MQEFALSERVGAITALAVTKKDSPRKGPSLKVALTFNVACSLSALDALGRPDEVDDDGVVVSSMGNSKPSDAWAHLFDGEGVPYPLGVKEHVFDVSFEERILTLQYSAAGKPTRPHIWNRVVCDGFKAIPSPGPGVFLIFKAKFTADPTDVSWLSSALCAALVSVEVASPQESFDMGGES